MFRKNMKISSPIEARSRGPLPIPGPSTAPTTREWWFPQVNPTDCAGSNSLPPHCPFHARARRAELVPAVSCFAFHTVISAHLPCPATPCLRRPSPGHRRSTLASPPSTAHLFPSSPQALMIVGFVPLAAVGGLESAGTASPCRGPLAAHHPPPSPYQCPVSPCVHPSILCVARWDRGPRLRFLSRRVDPAGALYQPVPPSTTV